MGKKTGKRLKIVEFKTDLVHQSKRLIVTYLGKSHVQCGDHILFCCLNNILEN